VATDNAITPPPGSNDFRTELKAKALFFPGFTLGAIWSPASHVDVAAWYKWLAPVSGKGDLTTASNFFSSPNPTGVEYGDTAEPYCYTLPAGTTPTGTPPCGNGNNATVKIPNPMEAKIGVRWHKVREDIPYDPHLRDPIAQDVFDLEADFTWANNSSFDNLEIGFPPNIPANPGIAAATLPTNADIRHHFRDVFGARLGSDYNVIPDKLAIRAGAFFETQAADTVYQNIDFDAAERFGLSAGATYRLHVGERQAIEFMLGYGHVFFGTLKNDNVNGGGVPALTGQPCYNGQNAGNGCTAGITPYRTPWAVNLGTITSEINVVNVGASYKF
jgi:long-chain fatty acid transport protein